MATADQQLSQNLPVSNGPRPRAAPRSPTRRTPRAHAPPAPPQAPKTFAPSREVVLSTLAFFFGDPAVPEKLKDYSEHHAM